MHEAEPERFVVGSEPNMAIVLAHGRGGSPDDMRALAEALVLDSVVFIFLKADGGVWYPNYFMAPTADNEPHLTAALAHYDRAVAALMEEGWSESRIVVGGFSQGACLTCAYLASHPRHYAAALIFTGGLLGPEGSRWRPRPELAGMPAYYASSKIDEWVPPSRAQETVDWLNASGAAVTSVMFEDRPHLISDAEIAGARQVVERARR